MTIARRQLIDVSVARWYHFDATDQIGDLKATVLPEGRVPDQPIQ